MVSLRGHELAKSKKYISYILLNAKRSKISLMTTLSQMVALDVTISL